MSTRLETLIRKCYNEDTRLKSNNPDSLPSFITSAELDELAELIEVNESLKKEQYFQLDSFCESTKGASYVSLHIPPIDYAVWECVKNNPHITRTELVSKTKIKINTLSGSVSRLLDKGYIIITGTKLDTSTRRNVQTLATRV